MDFVEYGLWLAGAVIVVGLIQWAKKLASTLLPRELPGAVWLMATPLASIIAGLAAGVKDAPWRILGIWAIAQIGYEGILKGILKKTGGEAPPEPPVAGFSG